MLKAIALLCALSLTACATPHKLAKCQGPLIALNTTHWQPTASDMQAFDKMCPQEDN